VLPPAIMQKKSLLLTGTEKSSRIPNGSLIIIHNPKKVVFDHCLEFATQGNQLESFIKS
jgi:hypothetical protein